MREYVISASELGLCIFFGDEIVIFIRHEDHECNSNYFAIQTDDRMWSIMKTPTSFQISGDDFEQFNIDFVDLDCGSVAESSNFGWLRLITHFDHISTTFYLEDRSKHKPQKWLKKFTLYHYVTSISITK